MRTAGAAGQRLGSHTPVKRRLGLSRVGNILVERGGHGTMVRYSVSRACKSFAVWGMKRDLLFRARGDSTLKYWARTVGKDRRVNNRRFYVAPRIKQHQHQHQHQVQPKVIGHFNYEHCICFICFFPFRHHLTYFKILFVVLSFLPPFFLFRSPVGVHSFICGEMDV